tara:strand:- start:1582 stop:2004 length:423 start_codon:yes stop_codon:yes gene_type:complete
MATATKKYYWYLHQNQLALVETPASERTVDGVSASYSTISTGAKKMRIHTVSIADSFPADSSATAGDLTSTTVGPLDEIPVQFHEALVYRVIAMGYKTRMNFDQALANFFDKEYFQVVRNAKKYARAGYQRDGAITPYDF